MRCLNCLNSNCFKWAVVEVGSLFLPQVIFDLLYLFIGPNWRDWGDLQPHLQLKPETIKLAFYWNWLPNQQTGHFCALFEGLKSQPKDSELLVGICHPAPKSNQYSPRSSLPFQSISHFNIFQWSSEMFTVDYKLNKHLRIYPFHVNSHRSGKPTILRSFSETGFPIGFSTSLGGGRWDGAGENWPGLLALGFFPSGNHLVNVYIAMENHHAING